MDQSQADAALLVLILGGLIFVTLAVRAAMQTVKLPPLVGFILIGMGLRWADTHWGVIPAGGAGVLEVLGEIGIIALLFRVGLESNLRALRMELKPALPIWLGNVAGAGLAGFAAAFWLLGLDLVASLFVAVALTATSVGVSVTAWRDAGALDSKPGQKLLDVAELDDISGVALMALLLAVVPALGAGGALGPALGQAGLVFALKLTGFALFCYALSRFLEPRFTAYWRQRMARPDLTVLAAALGIMIAALAGWIGLSVAIGALFAGFVFSRDRDTLEDEAAYAALIDVFAPFFFIAIGMKFAPEHAGAALALAGPLLLAAAAGKLLGAGLPALRGAGLAGAAILGVSMIPRAEVAMIIVERGLEAGHVSEQLFSAMVMTALATSLIAPALLIALFRICPPK